MSDAKLKPCPFCGGEAQIISREFFDDSTNELVAKFYGVRCIDCDTIHGQLFKEQLKAINSWNTRKPMERIVEMLEERYAKLIHKVVSDWNNGHLNDYEDFVAEGIEEAIEIVKEEGGV